MSLCWRGSESRPKAGNELRKLLDEPGFEGL